MKTSLARRAGKLASIVALPLALPIAGAFAFSGAADAHPFGDHQTSVYTLSNEATGNAVLQYRRTASGSLALTARVTTGGLGSGAGLGSQGAVTISDDGQTLLAVNAGSNTISEFAIGRDGRPRLVDTESSGGIHPISVTVNDNTVYALNDGDNSIVGFRLQPGRLGLRPLPGATQHLTGTGPAQVSFSPSGRQLVVTEKASDVIDVFAVDDRGLAGPASPTASTGVTPFGFAFADHDNLLVANAAGGATGASSISSYRLDRSGSVSFVAGDNASGQTSACWTAVSEDGRYAYTANTGSGTITGYRVGRGGAITPLTAGNVTATTGAGAADVAISGEFLYTRNGGAHTITVHHIERDGSLTAVGNTGGLVASDVGLIAG